MSEPVEYCPYGYSDPQRWCDWRNENLRGSDVRWEVGANGVPTLGHSRAFSVAHTAKLERANEEERRKFNHRQQHPVTA